MFRKKNENKIFKLPIPSDTVPCSFINQSIRNQILIDMSLKILIYDIKSEQLYKESEMITKGSFLEYELVSYESLPPIIQDK
jgi:hypothetical protein